MILTRSTLHSLNSFRLLKTDFLGSRGYDITSISKSPILTFNLLLKILRPIRQREVRGESNWIVLAPVDGVPACTVLLAVVVGSLFRAAVGQRAKPLLPGGPSCSTADNYTDGSPYKRNLDELLAGLPAAAGGNGWFYNGTAGAPGTADQVFGLIMCYADRNATQCRECLAGAPAGITTACPGSRSVRAAYDACVLHYRRRPPSSPPPTST
ncbi:hypothetical protein ZWY2020_059792 [Hordeum vulgare]|nr:hypothetical protein ZWY2020_059792 [Hordeum vulgare]